MTSMSRLFIVISSFLIFLSPLWARVVRVEIQKRYGSREEYLGRVAAVALELMDQGYLLSQDVPQVVMGAAARWDHLMR